MRMIQPYAVGSKGGYFRPEIDDEVLIGFEGGSAERPYVMGSNSNGREKSGYHTAGNDIKVIRTRSGCKIVINDADGSILTEDKAGSKVFQDGKGNIDMSAPKNFTINAGEDVNITAGKNVSVNAGENMVNSANKDISQTAGHDLNQTAAGDIIETSNNKTEIVEKNYNRESGESADLFSKKFTAHSSEEDMLLKSKNSVKLNSGEKSVNH